MKIQTNIILQLVVGLIAQVANAATAIVPDSDKVLVAAALSVVQGIAAIIAHYSNPDGTPSSEPFKPA